MTFSRPLRNPGYDTPDKQDAIDATHHFTTLDGSNWNCLNCDVKPYTTSSTWPCGANVPREEW